MYLIKKVIVDNLAQEIYSIDGLNYLVFDGENDLILFPSDFFGLKIRLKPSLCNDIKETDIKNLYSVIYANSYDVKSLKDGFKELVLNISKKEEKIDGYIVFIDFIYNPKTDGEIICDRDCNRLALVLREGNYLKFSFEEDERIIKSIDGKLMLMKEL